MAAFPNARVRALPYIFRVLVRDAARQGCYLETFSEAKVRFCGQYGSEATSSGDVLVPGGPPVCGASARSDIKALEFVTDPDLRLGRYHPFAFWTASPILILALYR